MPAKSLSLLKKFRPLRTRGAKSRKNASRHIDALTTHRHWLAQADAFAHRPATRGGSPHPSIKVGAILLDKAGKILARSSNRFAHGVDRRRPERYAEGWKSYWINCAEQMVIAEALRKRAELKGAQLYVTLEPCAICAGMIGEMRLREVFVPANAIRRYAKLKAKWKNSIEVGVIKLAEAGVKLTSIDTRPPVKAKLKAKTQTKMKPN